MKDGELNISGLSRLTFGISGHRDLLPAKIPELREQIRLVFSRFRAAYPRIVFELLSPLAEGADRLAADVGLSLESKLLVPMPMPQQEYERDFTTPASLAEFHRLLSAAESHWVVEGSSGQTRSDRYAAVGDYIARHSHIFILLWDGQDNGKLGGTAWVKQRRDYWTTSPKYGPTIQIVTPRVAGNSQNLQVKTIGELP
ncbi:MAG: hypothetical protein DLM73_04735 [Chthoniobacterales bacterium]|nr:MAG: hypothetical protein DLM73_04735 [Chthoniobacterales bacterium]